MLELRDVSGGWLPAVPLVAGCAAGCGILQSISSAVEVPAVADLNAHPLSAPIQGHRRSRSAPVSELAQIDLLVPCAFR